MKNFKIALAGCALIAASFVHAQTFQSGNIVVKRLGDGTGPLADTGNPVSLLQFTPAGTLVSTTDIPSTGASAVIADGSRPDRHKLTLSDDGRFLLFNGYARALPNATTLRSLSGAAIPRTVVRVDAFGNIDSSTRLTDAYSGMPIMGVGSPDGVRLYTAGARDGVRFTTIGETTAPTRVNPTVTLQNSVRTVRAINGNLYYVTTASFPDAAIYRLHGYPLTAAIATRVLSPATGPGDPPMDFTFTNNGTRLYVANDGGGIQRFDLGPTGFTFTYTIDTFHAGVLDLTEQNGTLFAITRAAAWRGDRLISLVDTGPGSPFTTLAVAPPNTAFSAVANAPNAPQAAFRNTTSGQVAFWTMQGTTQISRPFSSGVPAGWNFLEFADFTGNKCGDPFFYNSSTNQIAAWFKTGSRITGTMLYTLPAGWAPILTGDFNGDGHSDIVFRRGLNSAIWLMNGRNVIGSRIVSTGDFQPQLAADLSGVGKDSIVWYDGADMAITQMDGLDIVATNVVPIGPNREIRGAGDFDGDNRGDLVVYHQPSDSMQILFMNGIDVTSTANFTALAGFEPMFFPRLTHSGRNDILFGRPGTPSWFSRFRVWIMNGATITNTATVATPGQFVVGINDFNRDGRDDVMVGSGSSSTFFLMNGTTVLSQATIGYGGTWLPFATPDL